MTTYARAELVKSVVRALTIEHSAEDAADFDSLWEVVTADRCFDGSEPVSFLTSSTREADRFGIDFDPTVLSILAGLVSNVLYDAIKLGWAKAKERARSGAIAEESGVPEPHRPQASELAAGAAERLEAGQQEGEAAAKESEKATEREGPPSAPG